MALVAAAALAQVGGSNIALHRQLQCCEGRRWWLLSCRQLPSSCLCGLQAVHPKSWVRFAKTFDGVDALPRSMAGFALVIPRWQSLQSS
jgi:hypothetical protein